MLIGTLGNFFPLNDFSPHFWKMYLSFYQCTALLYYFNSCVPYQDNKENSCSLSAFLLFIHVRDCKSVPRRSTVRHLSHPWLHICSPKYVLESLGLTSVPKMHAIYSLLQICESTHVQWPYICSGYQRQYMYISEDPLPLNVQQ